MADDVQPPPTFLVDPKCEPVLIRVQGRATFQNCAPLKEYLNQALAAGRRRFVLDFARCAGMDSTFLGVLVGAALKLRKLQPPGGLTLARLGARNHELVLNLGLHRLVTLDQSGAPVVGQAATALTGAVTDELASARLVLEAHENLTAADPANAARFQDVIALVRQRLEEEK